MSNKNVKSLKKIVFIYIIGFVVLSIFFVPLIETFSVFKQLKSSTIEKSIVYQPVYNTGEYIEHLGHQYEITIFEIDKNRLQFQLLTWTVFCIGLGIIVYKPSEPNKV